MKVKKLIALFLALALSLTALPWTSSAAGGETKQPQTEASVSRLAGSNRILTAVAVAQKYYQMAKSVILVRGDSFADALSASPYAFAKNAPILLVDRDRIDPAVEAEIRRLGATDLTIVGGTSVVSEQVEEALKAFDSDGVERIAGADRYETSALMARALAKYTGGIDRAVIATGADFADAIAITPYTSPAHMPILLVKNQVVSDSVKQAISDLGITGVTLVGGSSAVSSACLRDLPRNYLRLEGPDRYATSVKVTAWYRMIHPTTFIVSGENYADALVISPVAASQHSPLLLTASKRLPEVVKNHLQAHPARKFVVLGGPLAINDQVLDQLSLLVK